MMATHRTGMSTACERVLTLAFIIERDGQLTPAEENAANEAFIQWEASLTPPAPKIPWDTQWWDLPD